MKLALRIVVLSLTYLLAVPLLLAGVVGKALVKSAEDVLDELNA